MYEMIGEYELHLDTNDERIVVNSPCEILMNTNVSDLKFEVQLKDLSDNNYLLIITKSYEQLPEILEFDDVCENALMKLKLGCASLVTRDVELSYDNIRIFVEDF